MLDDQEVPGEDGRGSTLMNIAVGYEGTPELANALLKKQVGIDVRDKVLDTPLITAC